MRAGFYIRTPACHRCVRWGTGEHDTMEALEAAQAEIDRIISDTGRKAYTEFDRSLVGSVHLLYIRQPTFLARGGGFVLESDPFDDPHGTRSGNWVVIPYDTEEPIQVWPDDRFTRKFQETTLKPEHQTEVTVNR